MADRNSSNDLLLEMLREIGVERGLDQANGLTLRSLERRLKEHAEADEKRHDAFDERLREVEQGVSKGEGVMETGRFHLPPTSINVNGARSKRPSAPSWLAEVTKRPTIVILVALATVLAHALLKLLH